MAIEKKIQEGRKNPQKHHSDWSARANVEIITVKTKLKTSKKKPHSKKKNVSVEDTVYMLKLPEALCVQQTCERLTL